MKTPRTLKLLTAIIFCGFASILQLTAQSASAYIPGFYTDMEASPESGDIGGIEIFVFDSYQGPYVVFTLAEGEPQPPVLVKAKLDGNKLSFKVGDASYTGQFTAKGLKLMDQGFERILQKGSLMNQKK